MSRRGAPAWAVGEFVGTFILVFFGCGSVAAAVLTESHLDLFEVAAIWGLGVALAIEVSGPLSGAHLNPAVTIALAAWKGFPGRRVPAYLILQFAGAFAALPDRSASVISTRWPTKLGSSLRMAATAGEPGSPGI